MNTRIEEVAEGIYQIASYMPEMDFGFNQYLVTGDEPLLFHTGMRGVFPVVQEHVRQVLDPATLRWITFGHVEADECGSMNLWLAAAPNAQVGAGHTAVMVSLSDLCDREPVAFDDGGEFDTGGHVMRWLDTPHVPHGWEAGVLYDATTKTLFCGDLFSQLGDYKASSTDDLIGPAIAGEDMFHSSSLAPGSGDHVRRLAELDVTTLALMHGPAFTGDCKQALLDLASDFDRRISA